MKLTYTAGPYDTNIAKFKLDLPQQLPSRLSTLQKACTAKRRSKPTPRPVPPASMIGPQRDDAADPGRAGRARCTSYPTAARSSPK